MTAPATALLEVRGLRVERGGVPVLDVPSFRLGEGEVVSLIGPNGSGKSTLLLSLMALLPRAAGQVLWRGQEVAEGRAAVPYRRRMAMVLQEPLLLQGTVHDNVAAGLRLRGVPRREERPRVRAWLERFGLAGMEERSARLLSGGEMRRVSLARAMAVEPEAVFLDEPFANLDAPTRQAITDDLERTLREAGAAAPGDVVSCGLRPEQVTIERASPAGSSSARNVFPARNTGVVSAGPYLKVRLDCGFPLVATVTGESFSTLGLDRGREVFASFKVTAVHVIRKAC